MEYGEATVGLAPGPGEERLIELAPRRIYDAAARGWYGGDMHVHLNWAGDLVGAPADAAVAQHGEDLHVLDLLAGNVSGRRVYDREALERWTDVDLPWSDATHVARMGVEYRNDLLGHIYAFAPRADRRRRPAQGHRVARVAQPRRPRAGRRRRARARGQPRRAHARLDPVHGGGVPAADQDGQPARRDRGHGCDDLLHLLRQPVEGQRVRVTATAVGPEVAAVRIRTAECAMSTPAR
ncbi:hypothetical protein ACIBO5_09455 [Nonomuraea angiospora]|uniref:hypothetical protein n=1 Tax=Nonomuraea angiospora TaxID=46172 RepID=UPI0037AC8482